MKKLLAILLALTFVMSCFAMTACSDNGDGEDTNDSVANSGDDTSGDAGDTADGDDDTTADEGDDSSDTTAGDDEPAGPNEYPYEHATDFVIGSIDFDWGAPRENSVYFEIDVDHVIHDGKGTWSNTVSCTANYAFDGDMATFYDCDEKVESVNTDEMVNYGVILEDWNELGIEATGYVGAWIEEGVVLHQIRVMTRSTFADRMIGNKFQASVDGVTWVDLFTVEALEWEGGDYEMFDIDDTTTYYYVRMVSRNLEDFNTYVNADSTDYYAYCNIAEFEIWGEKPAA